MLANYASCVGFTLEPDNDGQPLHITAFDHGGATAWGITRTTLSRWLCRPATTADLLALTKETAGEIYRSYYWDTIAGDVLSVGVDLMVFDAGVMSGNVRSAKILQDVLHVKDDGHIGPITLAAMTAMQSDILICELRAAQENYYRGLAQFTKFGRGWINRMHRRAVLAITMALSAPLPTTTLVS
jgi:lysozyme family protein